jgi:hypothetical protein
LRKLPLQPKAPPEMLEGVSRRLQDDLG